jgi:hypothetical protein
MKCSKPYGPSENRRARRGGLARGAAQRSASSDLFSGRGCRAATTPPRAAAERLGRASRFARRLCAAARGATHRNATSSATLKRSAFRRSGARTSLTINSLAGRRTYDTRERFLRSVCSISAGVLLGRPAHTKTSCVGFREAQGQRAQIALCPFPFPFKPPGSFDAWSSTERGGKYSRQSACQSGPDQASFSAHAATRTKNGSPIQ